MQPMVTRLVIFVLVVACAVGLYVAVDTVLAAPLKAAQQVAQNRFGTDLIKLCQSTAKKRGGALPANAKIGAIDSVKSTVYDDYDAALPANLRATDKTDVTVLLCLAEEQNVFDESKYGNPPKYTCTQYTRDITAYLVDVQTGATLNYKAFDGQTPPDCPDQTDSNVTRTGDIPLASAINSWIAGLAKGNA